MITFALDPFGRRVYIGDTASNADYFCPVCGTELIPKKGEIRHPHFAHKGDHPCSDSWTSSYDNTEWHDTWQGYFPRENREITLTLGNTRHRADVLTGYTVIEFQKSALSADHFNDRNTFYKDLGYKVIWLFDLRDEYQKGSIRDLGTTDAPSFSWSNPRKAFRAYDLENGDIDLFLQLKDDNDEPCIVRPYRISSTGFESFSAQQWICSSDFLDYVGFKDGTCPPPEMKPLEPNDSYMHFKQRFGIELNHQQERAAQVVDGATLLVAVPGSGKTTVLVTRLGYLTIERGVDPSSIICITYTTAAAEEMRFRFIKTFKAPAIASQIKFCTINKLAKDIYTDWCTHTGNTQRLIDRRATRSILRDAYRRATKNYPNEGDLVDIETAISYLKNMMNLGDGAADTDIDGFDEILRAYQREHERQGLMDFDDQIQFAFDALPRDKDLWKRWRERYAYWCVDEAQDTSKLQHNLLYRLVGREGNIFMVGDEDQSIYGYRGAYPAALLNFKYVYKNPFILKMERNYRSGEEIVSAAKRFIGRNKGRIKKDMVAHKGEGSVVYVQETGSRAAQWQAVCDLINNHDGELAVIFRNNDIAIPLVDRLVRADVPFVMRKGKRTYFDSAIIGDVKAFFALAANHYDAKAFKKIYAKTNCYIRKADAEWAIRKCRPNGPDILEALITQMSSYRKRRLIELSIENAERFAELIRDLSSQNPADSIATLLSSGYAEYLEERGQLQKLVILEDLARRTATSDELFERLRQLDDFYANPAPPQGGANLTLTSVHSSKGLEFDSVVIMDAVNGTFPSTMPNAYDRSKDSAATYQEERRLFYVAMTRARDELILIRPRGEATPFIDEVAPRVTRPHVPIRSSYPQ